MRRLPVLTCVLSLLGVSASAQQVFTLASGDRLSGQLRRIAGATWVIAYGGAEVAVPAAQVTGWIAPTVVGIRLADGRVFPATVDTAADSLLLRRADGSEERVAPAGLAAVGSALDLKALQPVIVGWFTPFHRFWAMTASVGLSLKTGNSRAHGLGGSFELERKSAHDRIDLGAGANREASQVPGGPYQTTLSKAYGFLQIDVYANPRLFASFGTRQEQDRFQDLQLRSLYTIGMGYQATARPATDLRFNLLAGYRREAYYSDGANTVPIVGAGWALKQTLAPAVITWRVDYTPQAGDFMNYQLVSNARVISGLYKNLGLAIGVLNEYNSRPQPGVRPNDLLATTTFTYVLPRK
ncbi:MAG TPA: DUF481 domain-containing protein [Gemmatimonadales bacterium]